MLQPGDILAGKYEIKETIGRGAFGHVYRAEERSLGRDVAIKELIKGEGEMGSTDYARFADRFRREARVQAQFNHPNIVHVYELLEPAPDAMYLVMEYVDGRSLRDRLAGGSGLPTEEAVRITLGLLEGLAVVHEHPWDIVHRDIKPSNVLLTGKGQPKLTDFGVAQIGDETTRTGPGVPHPGTPVYMSPEQAGTTAYLYPASDLFSVGCVLFEMLAGVPYRKATGMGKSLRGLRPNVPGRLEGIVAKSLEKDSERRFRSAREFAGALEQGLQTNRQRRERRSRLIPILVGGLALLLVAGLGFGAWRAWEQSRSAAATGRASPTNTPTVTPVPPTATFVPPTATPVPSTPTATQVPPTPTPVPSTPTPVPPPDVTDVLVTNQGGSTFLVKNACFYLGPISGRICGVGVAKQGGGWTTFKWQDVHHVDSLGSSQIRVYTIGGAVYEGEIYCHQLFCNLSGQDENGSDVKVGITDIKTITPNTPTVTPVPPTDTPLPPTPTDTPLPPTATPSPTATPQPPTPTPKPTGTANPPTATLMPAMQILEARVIYHDGVYEDGMGKYRSGTTPWLDLLVRLGDKWYGPERDAGDDIDALPLPEGYRWEAEGGFDTLPDGEAWWVGPATEGTGILIRGDDEVILSLPLQILFYGGDGGDNGGGEPVVTPPGP